MIDLYRRDGGAPEPLPSIAYDADHNAYTAPYAAADLKSLGFAKAPVRPADTDTQTAQWDATSAKWVMVDRPSLPVIEPRPKLLGRLGFIRHVQTTGGMTDKMLVDARNDERFAALWIKLDMAEGVERDDPLTAEALAALHAAGYMPKGVAAVIDGWPMQ